MEPVSADAMLLGIKVEAWAIIWATFFGPIAAVLITRWHDARAGKRERRMAIFRTLMATRRQAITVDHVSALNQIEVEFYKVKSVENEWKIYINHLNSWPVDRQPSHAEQAVWDQRRADLLAKLLAAIGSHLGYILGEIDIRNGGYAPEGWQQRDLRTGAVQEYILDLAAGKRNVPVAVIDYTQPRPQAEP